MKQSVAHFVPVVILGAGVLLVSGIREQFKVPPRTPMASIPSTFSGVTGQDVAVPDDERRVAGMTDYVMRNFIIDSDKGFSIYVGYYDRQVQGKSIHSPKNCLPGAGWEIMSSRSVVIPNGATNGVGNRVLLGKNGSQAIVYYWYQGRGRIEASEYRVKWDLMRDAALHGRTEEALVRVVVAVDSRATADPSRHEAELARADSLGLLVSKELAAAVSTVLPVWPGALR